MLTLSPSTCPAGSVRQSQTWDVGASGSRFAYMFRAKVYGNLLSIIQPKFVCQIYILNNLINYCSHYQPSDEFTDIS